MDNEEIYTIDCVYDYLPPVHIKYWHESETSLSVINGIGYDSFSYSEKMQHILNGWNILKGGSKHGKLHMYKVRNGG